MDLTSTSFVATPNTALAVVQWNGQSRYGFTDWAVGVSKDVTGVDTSGGVQSLTAKELFEIDESVDPDVLFPVRLDDFVLNEWDHPRQADVVAKVIGDATAWATDPDAYKAILDRITRDLTRAPR